MKLRIVLLPILILINFTGGCAWFNPEKDVVQISPLPKVKNEFEPEKIWRKSIGEGTGNFYSNLRLAYANNMIYAADRYGIVKAFSLNDGKVLWQVNLSEKDKSCFFKKKSAMLSGGLTVDNNRLYIGSERGQVIALNSNNGSLIWKKEVIGEVLSRPVISNKLVIIHTSNGMLQGIYQKSGKIKWTINLGVSLLSLRGESTPSIAFGAAIVGSDSGNISAVNLDQGQIIWQQRISQAFGMTEISNLGDVDSNPKIINGIVYAIAYNGNLTALDLRSGQILWKYKTGSVHDIAVNDRLIYIVDKDDRVIALNILNGISIWHQNNLLYRGLTSPILYKNYLVVADSKGYLHWMNTDNGHFVTQQKLNTSGFQSDPIVADEKLLIQSRNGNLYVIKI